jgi:hypothetical protein
MERCTARKEQYAYGKAQDRQGVGGTGVGLIDTLISLFFLLIFLGLYSGLIFFSFSIVRAFGWITITDITHSFLEYTLAPPLSPSIL